MTKARLRAVEYDIVNFTDDAEWVLRDDQGDVVMFEEGERERVQVRCDRCGSWNTEIVPFGSRWVCADRGCVDLERAAASAS